MKRQVFPTKAKREFLEGCRYGLPIALGYVSVSFAFGILAVEKGLPLWSPILISATNFTGTGQFAGADLIAAGAGLAELALTILIINFRYLLMSLSLSQRIDTNLGLGKRLLIACGVTDEVFAVAMQRERTVTFAYFMGLSLTAYLGWLGGTTLGTLANTVLPLALRSALGIALYAMFIAIIVPPARSSRPIALIIAIAVVLSCLFRYVPFLQGVSSGWVIIIAGLSAALLGAWFFPLPAAEESAP